MQQLKQLFEQNLNAVKNGGTQQLETRQTSNRQERFERLERPKQNYVKNPLNYALVNTYKLQIAFKDGKSHTFIALVAQTTYNAYKYGYPAKFDYYKAFNELLTKIKVNYYGRYKVASIYQCTGLDSVEILRFEFGREMPAKQPFDGILFDNYNPPLNLDKLQ